MTKEELKNYRIKTLKEFIKEFSRPGDENIPEMEEWRSRVPKSFVIPMNKIAGKPLSQLKIESINQKSFSQIKEDESILSVLIDSGKEYDNLWEVSKAMVKPILDEKINKILNL